MEELKRHIRFLALSGLVSFFCLHLSMLYGQRTLIITNCNSGEPIRDIYILDATQNNFLGYTNEGGVVSFSKSKGLRKLHFKKLGSIDTTVSVNPNQTALCLLPDVNKLKTVEINGKTIPLNEQFERFIEKTVSVLPMEDDSLYYSFQYTIEVPDSGWKANVSGIIMIPVKSYKKANGGGYAGRYCSLKIRINPDFYIDNLFTKLNANLLSRYYLYYDFLRKSFPYRKKIKTEMVKNKETFGDSTLFFAKGFGRTQNYPFSSTVLFNNDSVPIYINWTGQSLNKSNKGQGNIPLASCNVNCQYSLKNEFRIKCLMVDGHYYPNDGAVYQIRFRTKLLEQDNCKRFIISILMPFDKTSISEHPEIQVEFYPSDSIKVNGANKL